jgi:hypothetical protein
MNTQPKQATHTPGPWEYHRASNYIGFSIAPVGVLPTLAAVERPAGSGNLINITAFNFPGETEANAAFIVTACNSHAGLLEALREYRKAYTAAWNVLSSDAKTKVALAVFKAGVHLHDDHAADAIAKATGAQL